MASPIFQTPAMNPVPFVEMDAVTNPAFHTKHLRQDWFSLSRKYWEREVDYFQKWQQGDTISFQINTPEFIPTNFIFVQVINCDNEVQANIPLDALYDAPGNTAFGVPLTTRQYKIPLAPGFLADGRYYILIKILEPDTESIYNYISEPWDLKDDWPGTVLFRYKCPVDDPHDVAFNLNPNFQFRVEGEFRNFRVTYKDSRFIDQVYDPELLYADKLREFDLVLGAKLYRSSEYGVPDWVLDTVSSIFVCPSVNIDNRSFVRAENATFERTERTPTPLFTATIAVEERNAERTTTFGGGDLALFMRPDTFPYAIGIPSISNSTQTISLITGQAVEIADQTAENAFLASLNSLPVNGSFSILNGQYIYTNADDEEYTSSTGVVMSEYLQIQIDGAGDFAYAYYGEHITIGANINAQYLPNVGQTGNSWMLPGTSIIRLYHRNQLFDLNFIPPIDTPVLADLTGSLPQTMNSLDVQSQVLNIYDLNSLNNASGGIKSFAIRNSALGNIGSAPYFDTLPLGQFANLVYLDLGYNKLTSSQVDDVLNGLANNTDYAGGGIIDLQNQSPLAPPTNASAQARNNLQAAGWAIFTD